MGCQRSPRSDVFGLVVVMACRLVLAANNYNCDDPLLSLLPTTSFESSSEFSNRHSAKFTRLNKREGAGGWSPLNSDQHQWLQIDLRDRMEISGVATQGIHGSPDWVTNYLLMFSDTGSGWKQYHQEDGISTIPGNSNADNIVHYKLLHTIRTRFLRFVPIDWNSEGRIGMRVEVYGCAYKSDVADFDGRSSLLYRFNQKSMSTVKDVISLKFKSLHSDGVLVHGEGQRGDYITLELNQGTLALHINLDDSKLQSSASSHTLVTIGSLLDDQHWHSVLIERFNKQVNFTIDKYTQHFRIKGDCDSLDVDYELSFGGIPLPGKPGTFLRKNFHGCIENLYYNGVNIIDLAKRRKPQIYTVGNVTFSCTDPQITPVTFTSSTSSYLLLPIESQADGFSIRFQVRTWNRDGFLFYTQLYQESEHLLLFFSHGKLKLTYQKSLFEKTEMTTGSNLNDGLWHTVSLSTQGLQVTLQLNNDVPSTMVTKTQLISVDSCYFGGCPSNIKDLKCKNPTLAFQGCMRLIFIVNQPVNLILVQQGLIGNFSDLQIDLCAIQDRCQPNFCEHGGQCSQSWNTFYCECSGTGYTGVTCHNSVYEPSCEAYSHSETTSGHFLIDSDGSGPLGPTLVYCDMTEDKVWTVLNHNNTEMTWVQGSSLENPYSMQFSYSLTQEQLQALVARAEHCEQEIIYRCWRSRLLNARDGTPFSWWIGRTGERQTYWSGSLPGVLQCACGLDENCIDMNYFCNCDADKEQWVNDTGLLSYKDHLPVNQIIIGDTNRTNSEAVYRVGPLKCHGDRNFWNAASFNKDTTYLHFSTFQAELSAHISFYFKTTVGSGVFLENLGVKDFIRIELISSQEVMFSFDVGNGPVNLSVKSPVPFNDKQWHFVNVERNVKQASLQVDKLPIVFQDASGEGHIRLQLNSQLFVGGTASRKKGFLGCIRSLTLNGVTLDLEEQAKLTSGVQPGCPGHCSSYGSLCHNGGKCTEKYNGYTCDCSNSAYMGPFCTKEVSVIFEAGSSMTYTFQESFLSSQNESEQFSAIFTEKNKPRNNITFSFLTTHTPAMLFFATMDLQEYMAIILSKSGYLQIWYRLKKQKETGVLSAGSINLANGQLHRIKIKVKGKHLYVQIDDNASQNYTLASEEFSAMKTLTLGRLTDRPSLDSQVMTAGARGFIGCLSSVQINQITPLKEVLYQSGSTRVLVSGRLRQSSCGSASLDDLKTISTVHSVSDHAGKVDNGKKPLANAVESDPFLIGGIIILVIIIVVCVMATTACFIHQYRSHQSTNVKERHDSGFNHCMGNNIDLQSAVSDRRMEYFI
ncbi:contactin-associated protein-like 5 [Erpetoichthys calabaricus]|uniref:contactin-associated protein-like 5 n=1 Tax=Erpetoichthys calabaricus TaxID=27687 RepID=UPI002234637F|nr:contactin-associated protein-like 5 [Erpetoichthys calabaricus]